MAVRNTPPISFNADIIAEFNGVLPHQLTEYYRGGANVPDITENNGVPTAGQISITDFYGAEVGGSTFSITVNGAQGGGGGGGRGGTTTITGTVASGVVIRLVSGSAGLIGAAGTGGSGGAGSVAYIDGDVVAISGGGGGIGNGSAQAAGGAGGGNGNAGVNGVSMSTGFFTFANRGEGGSAGVGGTGGGGSAGDGSNGGTTAGGEGAGDAGVAGGANADGYNGGRGGNSAAAAVDTGAGGGGGGGFGGGGGGGCSSIGGELLAAARGGGGGGGGSFVLTTSTNPNYTITSNTGSDDANTGDGSVTLTINGTEVRNITGNNATTFTV